MSKYGAYWIRGTSSLLCILYLKQVLHNFLLDSRLLPKFQKLSDHSQQTGGCICISQTHSWLHRWTIPGNPLTNYRAPWLTTNDHAVIFLIHPVLGILFSVHCLLPWPTPVSCWCLQSCPRWMNLSNPQFSFPCSCTVFSILLVAFVCSISSEAFQNQNEYKSKKSAK